MAPTVRSFSAGFDPLRLIAQFPDCYPGILESGSRLGLLGEAGGNDDARFDILPFANGEFLSLPTAGGLKGRSTQGGFLDALNRWCRELRSGGGPAGGTQAPGLPFRGGWMVYLGYEIAAEVEPCLMLPPSTDRLTALALRTPAAWIRDRRTGNGWLVAESGHEGLLERFQAHCRQIGDAPPADRPKPGLQIREEEPEAFLGRVERALEYIAAGEIYQANLSRGWSTQSAQALDPVVVYQRLRRANPGPFCALLRFGDFAVASSSPERLVMSDGRRVRTRPIAGTRPRGSTTQSDAALIRELTGSEKERAEHIMLIDLERNDLGRVCEGGSVEVDEFMVVESYAHVHHIVSSVVGNLRSGVGIVDILKAVFPGGTITGCPKVRCMQIIAELEAAGRGAYTGSLGYINTDGSADFNILIRTMSINAGRLDFRAGAGIVADSDPHSELQETRAKAEGLVRALSQP